MIEDLFATLPRTDSEYLGSKMFVGEREDSFFPPEVSSPLLVSSGIYDNENPEDLTAPAILHMDYQGYWAPLSHLYFSSSSKILVARHPESCEEELQGFLYCPQCLTRFQSEDVSQYFDRCPTCFTCPRCTSILTVANVPSSSSYSMSDDGQLLDLKCDFCPWRSSSSGIVGKAKGDLESSIADRENNNDAAQAFNALLGAYKQADIAFLANRDSKSNATKHDFSHYLKHGVDTSLPDGKITSAKTVEGTGIFESERWDVQSLEEKLAKQAELIHDFDPDSESPLYRYLHSKDPSWQSTMQAKEHSILETIAKTEDMNLLTSLRERETNIEIGTASMLASNLLPARVPLRSRRTLRCRRDVEEGKLSILLQPKTMPLEGDSSQKLQRGKWWMKDASAVHIVPRIILRKIPTCADILNIQASCAQLGWIHITITNPQETAVTIELTNIQPQQSGQDLLCRYPAVDEVEEEVFHVSLSCPSPPIEIGCYEDELLLEDDDEVVSSTTENVGTGKGDGTNQGWKISVRHNVAYVSMPIESGSTQGESTRTQKIATLTFSLTAKNSEDGEITQIYSQVILP